MNTQTFSASCLATYKCCQRLSIWRLILTKTKLLMFQLLQCQNTLHKTDNLAAFQTPAQLSTLSDHAYGQRSPLFAQFKP